MGESESEFRGRLGHFLREKKDELSDKLRKKYAKRIAMIEKRVARAQEKIAKETAQAKQQKVSAALSLGATILGAFMGRKALSQGNLSKAATTLGRASKISKENADIEYAKQQFAAHQEDLQQLQQELEEEILKIEENFDPEFVELEAKEISPLKSDIKIKRLNLAWAPK